MDYAGPSFLTWYYETPIVTRVYMTAAFLATALCALDVISPHQLYFNGHAIARGEVWRLVTSFLFFGPWGLDVLLHMYFVAHYSKMLEEASFRGRAADFAWMLMLGAALLIACAPAVRIPFFGQALTFMVVYVWTKRNPGLQISILGLLVFPAPYLTWVLLGMAALAGGDLTSDALGLLAGHLYYVAADVLPALGRARGWRPRLFVRAPWLLRAAFGEARPRGGGGGAGIEVANDPLLGADAGGGGHGRALGGGHED